MRNMLKIVEYYERRSENQNPRSYREKLQEILARLDNVTSIEELMAQEGNYREVYYSFIDDVVVSDDLSKWGLVRKGLQRTV